MAIATTTLLAGAALATTAYSANRQAKAQKKSAKAQRRSLRTQQKMSDLTAGRERRQMLAKARVMRAQQQAAGFSSGIGQGSSVVQGAIGGLGSQAASNFGFSAMQQGLARQAGQYNIAAGNAQSDAAKWGAIGSFSQTIFGMGIQASGLGQSSTAATTPAAPSTGLAWGGMGPGTLPK